MSKNEMIMLQREVVERALAALDAEDPYRAAVALRAALEQPQCDQEPVAGVVIDGSWNLPSLVRVGSEDSHIKKFGGNRLYTHPQPQVEQEPYLYYDPANGDTWTQEAINDGCCLPDGLIALYTKETK